MGTARALTALAMAVVPLVIGCSGAAPTDQPFEPVAETAEPLFNGTPSAFAYAGVVMKQNGGYCTGSLVGRNTVLTSAHCLFFESFAKYCVFPCGNMSSCAAVCSDLGQVTVHEDYENDDFDPSRIDHDHDIAIIRFVKDLTLLTGVTPLMIGGPVQEDEIVTLVGWGCDKVQNTTGDGQQRYGYNSISDVNDFTLDYDDESRTHACEEPWDYLGRGDSGGPATVYNCVIGLNSGQDDGLFGTDYKLTRVDKKVDWIRRSTTDQTIHDCFNPQCGDGLCQYPETCSTCPSDCPTGCPRCGDGRCDTNETPASCPADCHTGSCQVGKSDCCDTGVCYTQAACKRLGCI